MLFPEVKVDLFLLTPAPRATPRDLETTISRGPFVVAARDASMARVLLNLNYAIATLRRPGEPIPTMLWSETGASECVRVPNLRESELRRREMVGDTDIAPSFLTQPSLTIDGVEVARMVWWPCGPNDQCPVASGAT